MNQALQNAPAASGPRRFNLEMIGFSPAEKAMLASTFRLTGRRAFFYAEATEPSQRTDIYLANGDSPAALKELAERAPNPYAPAVLIGRSPMDIGWPRVEKPIHWMRLFDQLDLIMQAALLERARRHLANSSEWDGNKRRAIDRSAEPEAVFLEPDPVEW
jgi:twitching motility two-component system response regulator PilG